MTTDLPEETNPLEEALRTAEQNIAAQLESAEARLEEMLSEVRTLEGSIEEARRMIGSSETLSDAMVEVLSGVNGPGMQVKDIAHKINAQQLYAREVISERVRVCADLHPDLFHRAGVTVSLIDRRA